MILLIKGQSDATQSLWVNQLIFKRLKKLLGIMSEMMMMIDDQLW
jgi:hypothetical protein